MMLAGFRLPGLLRSVDKLTVQERKDREVIVHDACRF